MASRKRKSVPEIGKETRETARRIERRSQRERHLENKTLPIWTTGTRTPIVDVRASDLTFQERKSVVDYWLNVWRFLEGLQPDIGDWTGESFSIAGYDVQTSLDEIEDHADEYNIPDINKDIYREL